MKPYLLLLLPIFAIAAYSCKKDDNGGGNTVTPGAGYRTLEEALVSGSPRMRSTALIVASGDTLYGGSGSRIMIPPNAFRMPGGGRVTGSVNVRYQDWIYKGDMVFGRVLPVSSGEPLMSAGQAYLSVTQNGQALRVSSDTEIVFQFPQSGIAPGAGLQGWSGRTQASASSIVNWIPKGTDGVLRPAIVADSVSMIADTIGYVAASAPLPNSGRINFSVRINSEVPMESSLAVALYDNVRAVYPLPSISNGRVAAGNVPGAPMHIAVMGINKGVFYGGITAVPSPGSDSTYQVRMLPTDPANFRLTMNAL